jgi:hypothetical protein
MHLISISLSALALLVGWASAASADSLDLDALAAKPGAVVGVHTKPDGSQTRQVELQGVVFWEERENDRIVIATDDRSGHFPIMCAWQRYVEQAALFDLCPGAHEETQIKQSLRQSIDRINDFIVSNLLEPVTKAQMEDRAARHAIRFKDMESALGHLEQRCGPAADWEALRKSADGQAKRDTYIANLKRNVDHLLAVPRPPVLGSCL